MGEIFLAKLGELKGFEKFVIIKKILPQLAEDKDFIDRFVDEVQVAIKLNHVNVAQVYEAGTVEGEYFLAIEYIEGCDLRRVIRRLRDLDRRLPVDQCVQIARDLAAGLAYAHRRTGSKGQALSLVHCDISPPNLMISYEGEVKIIDFGIARSAIRTADSNPQLGFGKFGYMAPEQLLRGGLIDRRTDIYAAGVVLYELLTGERLYQFPEGTDYRVMARMVIQGKFTPPDKRDARVDATLNAIVCKALATKPEDRYQYAEEFRDALQQRLSQINPTISTDTLARTMDDLFHAERQGEQEDLQAMRAVDAAAYRQEITEAAGHTVTFARMLEEGAALPDDGPTTAMPLPPVHESPTQASLDASFGRTPSVVVSGSALRPTTGAPLPHALRDGTVTSALPAHDSSWRSIRLGLLAFLLVFVIGAGMYYQRQLARRDPPPPPPIAVPEQVPTPTVEHLPAPEPVPPPVVPSQPPVTPRPKVVKPVALKKPVPRIDAEPTPAALEKKRLEVDRKFQAVRAEYLDFRKKFANRLEGRWQSILQNIALGRRDQAVSDDLDTLRREMKQVQSKSE